jgi:hypothetical protein
MGHRARISWWWRRLITVRVIMWHPNAKLPRRAPAALNGRCRARLDINRSSLGVVLQGLPAHGRSVAFPVWRKRCISRTMTCISLVMSYLIGQSFCISIGQLFMKWSFLIGSFFFILIGECQEMRARWPIKRPQLTLRHRHSRFDWSHDQLGWTIRTWRRVYWSDESLF